MDLIIENGPMFIKGLTNTLTIALLSIVIAAIIGTLSGLMSMSKYRVLRFIANTYVMFVRGVPLLVLAFTIYFGIPYILKSAGIVFRFPIFYAALATLSLNAGAYMSEIIRGGIQSVNSGQMEAALSLGLPHRKAMRLIIMPQALKMMIPAIINQFIISLKDTSILSVIGFAELTNQTQVIIGRNLKIFEMWAIAGVMYFVMCTLLAYLGRAIEKRLSYHD